MIQHHQKIFANSALTAMMLAAILVSPATYSASQNGHSNGHSHGEGLMTIIFDQGQLAIEVRSPAADILGYEHAPQTPEQHAILKKASQQLHKPHALIMLPSTCTLLDKNIEMPYTSSSSDTHQHQAHQNEPHPHNNNHPQPSTQTGEHKYAHQHHPAKPKQANTQHTNITAYYSWQCSKESPLNSIAIDHFTHYPAFKRITVQWIINGKQGSKTLTPHNTTLRF